MNEKRVMLLVNMLNNGRVLVNTAGSQYWEVIKQNDHKHKTL